MSKIAEVLRKKRLEKIKSAEVQGGECLQEGSAYKCKKVFKGIQGWCEAEFAPL